MKFAIEVVGWAGAALILGAYALLSAGRLRAESLTYHLMNILGASGFVINSGYNGALPSAVMNVVWIGIGVYRALPVAPRRPCALLKDDAVAYGVSPSATGAKGPRETLMKTHIPATALAIAPSVASRPPELWTSSSRMRTAR